MHKQELSIPNKDFLSLIDALLAQKNTLRFKTKGTSMLALINGGDTVEVSPQVNDIAIGDILLYRNSRSEGIVHRMVGRLQRGSQTWVAVKGDASLDPDELISQEQILGKVIAIHHKKRRISFLASLSFILHKIQRAWPYAVVAKAIMRTQKGFYLEVKESPGITFLSLKKQERLVGCAELSMDSIHKDAFILSSLWVHWAYRRAGLGKKIMKEALSYCHKKKVKELRLFISRFNRSAMALYQKEGFLVIPAATTSGYGPDFIQLKRDVEDASCDTPEIWH